MEYLQLLIALVLPALLGGLWVGLLVPADTPARSILVWGNGLLVGLLAIPLLMRLLDALSIPLTFLPISFSAGALILVAALLSRYSQRPVRSGSSPVSVPPVLTSLQLALIVLFTLLIVLRLTSLGLELVWRPLFPWDATMHWATKARVWYEYASIVPFVDNSLWLELGGEGVFTDHHPGYPITTPLLQVWMSAALGRWDESLINLPWLACLIALGAAFYSQARVAGSTVLTAVVFAYMLLSMPLINTHVALAGYADLFLGACYCAAIMAFHNWSVTRQCWQGALALVFACCCPLIKNEGFYWFLTLLPAMVVVLLPMRKALVLLAGLLLALVAVLILLPGDFEVAGHSLDRLNLHYHSNAAGGIATSFWLQDNWHLLGYLLVGMLVLSVVPLQSRASACLGVGTALASAVVLFLLLFLYTKYAFGAVRLTAVGRISVQLVPALLFLALLLYNEVVSRGAPREELAQ